MLVAVLASGCGTPSRQVRLGDQTIDPGRLTSAEVTPAVKVATRGDDTIYRAPTLSSYKEVDLTHGGPALGNMGIVKLGRQGFLFGVRRGKQPVKSYAAFQSDLVEGKGRYIAVTLADGTALPIRTTKSNMARCEPDCLLVFETVVVELPDAVLRAVPADGLVIDYRLDDGTVTRATAPAAYVKGYLQAIDAAH
jgi:hypothetical protein